MNVLAFFLAQSESIDTYLPREGPETQGSCKSRQKPNHLYSYLSTSRGAGNVWIRPCTMTASRIAPYLPRKGPETQ